MRLLEDAGALEPEEYKRHTKYRTSVITTSFSDNYNRAGILDTERKLRLKDTSFSVGKFNERDREIERQREKRKRD